MNEDSEIGAPDLAEVRWPNAIQTMIAHKLSRIVVLGPEARNDISALDDRQEEIAARAPEFMPSAQEIIELIERFIRSDFAITIAESADYWRHCF